MIKLILSFWVSCLLECIKVLNHSLKFEWHFKKLFKKRPPVPMVIKKTVSEKSRGKVMLIIQYSWHKHTPYIIWRGWFGFMPAVWENVWEKNLLCPWLHLIAMYIRAVCVGGCKYEMCGPRSPFSFFSFLHSFAALPGWLPVFPIVHWSPLCRQEVEEQAAAQLYRSTTWYTKQL